MQRKLTSILIVIFTVLVLDQVTKLMAVAFLKPLYSVSVLGDFLRLTYVENRGMAFGLEITDRFLFNILSLIAVAVILYYLYVLRESRLMRFTFAIILGGAFGNLIDRFTQGYVVDFVDIEFFDIHLGPGTILGWEFPAYSLYRWPVFNVADVAVTIGMLIILASAFLEVTPRSPVNHAASEEI